MTGALPARVTGPIAGESAPALRPLTPKLRKIFDAQGLRLIHVDSYVENGQRFWYGISRSGTWANRWFIRDDLD